MKKKVPDIKNSEILMVGDSIERDLKPVKKLGLKTAIARFGQISKEAGTVDYELEKIDDLKNIV